MQKRKNEGEELPKIKGKTGKRKKKNQLKIRLHISITVDS